MLKKIIAWLIRTMIAGVIACALLSVFVSIYHYEGVHIDNAGNGTDYKWEPLQWKTQMTEGFAWFRMDENGFNNISVPEQVDVLLMGSSHMESCEVAQEKNLGTLLNSELPNYKTYNIGIGGHTIYRCIDNIEEAIAEYAPSKYIIIETDRVKLNSESMRIVTKGEASAISSYDSGIMYYLQKIPAIKMMYSQISNWIDVGKSSSSSSNEEKQIDWELYEEELTAFLTKAGNAASAGDIKLVIFYQPPTRLRPDGSIDCGEKDELYLSAFSNACGRVGIEFIDLTQEFRNMYSEKHILVHGFSNTAVGEGHLNEYGHRIIADTLSERIRMMDGE